MADSLTSAYEGGRIATGLSHGDPPERRARAVLARLLAEPGSHLVVRYHPPTVGDGPDGPALFRVDRRAPDGALLGTDEAVLRVLLDASCLLAGPTEAASGGGTVVRFYPVPGYTMEQFKQASNRNGRESGPRAHPADDEEPEPAFENEVGFSPITETPDPMPAATDTPATPPIVLPPMGGEIGLADLAALLDVTSGAVASAVKTRGLNARYVNPENPRQGRLIAVDERLVAYLTVNRGLAVIHDEAQDSPEAPADPGPEAEAGEGEIAQPAPEEAHETADPEPEPAENVHESPGNVHESAENVHDLPVNGQDNGAAADPVTVDQVTVEDLVEAGHAPVLGAEGGDVYLPRPSAAHAEGWVEGVIEETEDESSEGTALEEPAHSPGIEALDLSHAFQRLQHAVCAHAYALLDPGLEQAGIDRCRAEIEALIAEIDEAGRRGSLILQRARAILAAAS